MGKAGSLWIEIGARLDKFNKGMSDAERSMVKVGKRFTAVGKKMTMMVTLPILALGAAAVKVGADFEQSITNAFAVTGAESEKVKAKMEALARTMGEKTIFSAREAADAMYFMASAGWKIEEMTNALEPTLALAAATQSELAFATEAVIVTLNQFGLQSSEAAKVSNVFAAAISGSQATLERLKESLKYIGPMADIMGWSIEDTTAILSSFYEEGIEASTAGTALRMAFAQLALGTPKTQKALKELGLTMADVNPETKSLGEIIETLSSKTMSLEQAIKIFGVRAGANMLKVLKKGSEAFIEFRDKITGTQAASEMMQKQLDTLSGQWKILTSKLTEAAIQISKILIPVLRELIEKHLKPAVDWFNNLSEGTKKTIVKFAGLAAVAGPLLLIFGKLLIILPKIKLAFAALTGPIGIIVTGLGVIAIKAKAAHGAFSRMSEAVKMEAIAAGKKVSWFKKAIYGLDAAFHKVATGLDVSKLAQAAMNEKIKEAQDNIKALKPVLDKVTKGFKDWFSNLIPLKKGLKATTVTAEDLFKQFTEGKITFDEYLKKLEELKAGHDDKLIPALKTTIPLLISVDTAIQNLARQFGEGKISIIEYVGAMQELRATAERIKNPFKDLAMVEGDVQIATEGMTDAYNVLKAAGVPATIYDQLTAVEKLKQGVVKATEEITIRFKSMTERFVGLALDMGDAFGDLAWGIMDKGSTLGENLKDLWTDIGNAFKSMVAEYIADEMKKLFLSIVKKSTDMATSVTSGLAGVGKAVTGIGKGLASLITTLATAIAKAATTLAAAAPALLVVLGIALAAYAGFKLISSLFKKKPETGTMEAILRDISHIQLAALLDKMDESNFFASEMFPKIDYGNHQLELLVGISGKIRDGVSGIIKAIKAIPGAQHGAIVTGPQLVTVAEAGPEAIVPLSRPSAIQGIIQGAGGGQRIINNITLNISAMDAIGVKEFMRNRGLPEIIEAVNVNYRGSKTKLKEAQGT